MPGHEVDVSLQLMTSQAPKKMKGVLLGSRNDIRHFMFELQFNFWQVSEGCIKFLLQLSQAIDIARI